MGKRSTRVAGVLALVALFIAGCPSSPGYLGWTYSLGSYEEGYSIVQIPDGGYVAFAKGRAKADNSSEPQALTVVLDPSGEQRWWTLTQGLYCRSVYAAAPLGVVDDEGHVLSVGLNEYYSNDGSVHSDTRIRVVAFEHDGSPLWDRTYGDVEMDPQVALPVDGGGVVIAGLQVGTVSSGFASSTFLLKLDVNGDVVWERHFDPQVNRMGTYGMTPVPGGGYILIGTGTKALRVDADGNQLWWKSYGDGYTEVHGVGVTSDGGFVMVGVPTTSPRVPTVLKADADGNLLWTAQSIVPQETGTHYLVHSALVDTAGRIVLVGEKEKVEYIGNFFPRITDEGYIMQLDSNANLNWCKSLGRCYVNGVSLMNTGDYVTVGTTGSHLQVIRVKTDGTVM